MSTPSEIQQIELFANLSPAAQGELAAVAHARDYQGGQVILLEGDLDSPVFFVLQGGVRIYHTNLDGREQTLIHFRPGASFNMPAAFTEDRGAPASAIAVGDVRLLVVSRHDFRRLVTGSAEMAQIVLADFSSKLYHLTDLAYDLSLRSVRARLARFLLTQLEDQRAGPTRWTHEQIAAQVGTVREVVSRTLRSFVRGGLIRMERQRIVVADREALKREAQT